MCVAILAKPGKQVPRLNLFAGWGINSDGGGFAFVRGGKVQIERGFMKYNAFQAALEEAQAKNPDSPFLIHMRIRSAGSLNENNTHPFPIEGGALIHNGTLFQPTGNDIGTADDRKSDTRVFAERLFNILKYQDVVDAKDDIERAIRYNKIALLYDDAKYLILNEAEGEWIDDIWYSNGSCKIRQSSYPGDHNHSRRNLT